jgi:hypothetical protein
MQTHSSVSGQWHIKSDTYFEDLHLFDVQLECVANQFQISYSVTFSFRCCLSGEQEMYVYT